jgi:hypothetical protein
MSGRKKRRIDEGSDVAKAHGNAAPLPSDLYGDTSHPLSAGYEMLARQLYKHEQHTLFAN